MTLVYISFNPHGEPETCSTGNCITSLKFRMINILYFDNYRITLKE